ncbi:hypothetical protein F0562_016688 [Nyssa sinensis]|uniref:Protein kinase domain-containing protein n=1 Tax=Nyssa sinensis TaxID=561372 RepID=A0A5J4ZCM8_9ASTE|nr:hypothetical protein F0562_016688 [Nyssa sinensis]
MCCKVNLVFFVVISVAASNDDGFTFNGSLNLDGDAEVAPDGLFTLTNSTTFQMGHAFYSLPLSFNNSSNGVAVQSNYVLGCSLQSNGKAQELDLSHLPTLPHTDKSKKKGTLLAVGLSAAGVVLVSITFLFVILLIKRKAKFSEIFEDWEVQYGPQTFSYKNLFVATKGFNDKEFIGRGGFGEVYRGMLPVSNLQVAVKRISHKSRRGMRELVVEIETIGRLRHPNLV